MKWYVVFSLFLLSCQNEVQQNKKATQGQVNQHKAHEQDENIFLLDSLNTIYKEIGLIDITELNNQIKVDLRYATANNFMNTVLYDTIRRAYLQYDVAIRLSKCQDFLDSLHPGYALLVFDAIRPQLVQKEMWDALDSIPRQRRGKFVSNPGLGSVHNFGAAVDLTIVKKNGVELNMGAGYDDFREIAFPRLESHFLETGELSIEQVENRKLLRRVMKSQGFNNIPSEWWHFNAYSRITASHRYQMLETESGNTKWFKIVPKKDSVTSNEHPNGQL